MAEDNKIQESNEYQLLVTRRIIIETLEKIVIPTSPTPEQAKKLFLIKEKHSQLDRALVEFTAILIRHEAGSSATLDSTAETQQYKLAQKTCQTLIKNILELAYNPSTASLIEKILEHQFEALHKARMRASTQQFQNEAEKIKHNEENFETEATRTIKKILTDCKEKPAITHFNYLLETKPDIAADLAIRLLETAVTGISQTKEPKDALQIDPLEEITKFLHQANNTRILAEKLITKLQEKTLLTTFTKLCFYENEDLHDFLRYGSLAGLIFRIAFQANDNIKKQITEHFRNVITDIQKNPKFFEELEKNFRIFLEILFVNKNLALDPLLIKLAKAALLTLNERKKHVTDHPSTQKANKKENKEDITENQAIIINLILFCLSAYLLTETQTKLKDIKNLSESEHIAKNIACAFTHAFNGETTKVQLEPLKKAIKTKTTIASVKDYFLQLFTSPPSSPQVSFAAQSSSIESENVDFEIKKLEQEIKNTCLFNHYKTTFNIITRQPILSKSYLFQLTEESMLKFLEEIDKQIATLQAMLVQYSSSAPLKTQNSATLSSSPPSSNQTTRDYLQHRISFKNLHTQQTTADFKLRIESSYKSADTVSKEIETLQKISEEMIAKFKPFYNAIQIYAEQKNLEERHKRRSHSFSQSSYPTIMAAIAPTSATQLPTPQTASAEQDQPRTRGSRSLSVSAAPNSNQIQGTNILHSSTTETVSTAPSNETKTSKPRSKSTSSNSAPSTNMPGM